MWMRQVSLVAARNVLLKRYYFATSKNSQLVEAEFTEVAQYPEIQCVSFTARQERKADAWHIEIQKTRTVEEKIIKINMPRYYGYRVIQLHDERLPYNCMRAIQHYTRTLYEDMPSEMKENGKLSEQVEALRGDVKDALEMSHDFFSRNYSNGSELQPMERERIFTQIIVEQINRALMNGLSPEYEHLQDTEVDYNPRHEACWFVGGIFPPRDLINKKRKHEWQKPYANDPVDRLMQYKSEPMLAMRHSLQLPTWKSQSEYEDFEKAKSVPLLKYDPRTLGFSSTHVHITNIPGYWPNKRVSFGFLSYQSRAGLHIRPQGHEALDHNEALHSHAMQSSFAWLLAGANYNGFNTFSELTYPYNTQTILTDGKTFSFYEYQLNTLSMHCRQIHNNPRVNYCRGTKELKLYQEIDDKGKVIGFNDQVLKYLISFYTNIPNVQRSVKELQPYLDATYKRIADYEEDEKSKFLEKTFKHLVSNRPRHLEIPEIYLWEQIYKISNDTRPLDPRRRYFELFINPWKRTLDQHQKEYIPRILRPDVPRYKNRWKPTFYP